MSPPEPRRRRETHEALSSHENLRLIEFAPIMSGAGVTPVNRPAAEHAAADLLAALGADLGEEGLRDTPRRMIEAYTELLTPRPFRPTTFANDEGYDELVVARSIPFHSLCMHHLLRFSRCRARGLPSGRSDHRSLQGRRPRKRRA